MMTALRTDVMNRRRRRAWLPLTVLVLCGLLTAGASAYAPALTPELVRAASTFYFSLPHDDIPLPSEWAEPLPDNQGAVMVVTPFIRLAMGLASDEFIANHQPASTLSPAVVDRLNQFYQDRLLLYVEMTHLSTVPPPTPEVQVIVDGKTIAARQVVSENRPRTRGEQYATRFFAHFALSDGIPLTDTIRVVIRRQGGASATLTFNLARMR